MLWLFVAFPSAILLCIDVGSVSWWIRRQELMNNGVPVTGEVVRINVSVTRSVDSQTHMSSSSTDIRPVVRFTTRTGESITTSPMRSGLDKILMLGEPVKLRYSAANPTRCVVDQRGVNQGAAVVLAVLAIANVFLIGFIVMALHFVTSAQMSGHM